MLNPSRFAWAALLGLAATVTSVLPAAAQTGLQFDGNDYVSFGQATSTLGASTFTIEVWFMRTGTGTGASTGAITAVPLIAKGRGESDGSNVDCNYFLGIQTSNNVLAADFEDNATGANHQVTGTTVILNNVWYHAAATFDGANFRLYLNGIQEGVVATGTTPRFDSIQHASIGSALNSTGVASGFFVGVLDEARIWSVARSEADLRAGALTEITAGTGLLGRWGLNDGSGNNAANSVGGSPSGTLLGTAPLATWVSGSPFAYAYATRYDGAAGFTALGDPAALDLAQFTIECWFRRDGTGVSASTGTNGVTAIPLLSHGGPETDATPVDMNYMLGIRASDGVLCADFEEHESGTGPTGDNHPVAGVTAVGSGWRHGAATYDGSTWRLYLDGNLEATLLVNQPPASNTTQHAALATMLRSAGPTGTKSGFFLGALDEARVWNYARTQAEIQASMNSQIASPQTGLVGRWGMNEGAGRVVRDTSGSAAHGENYPVPVSAAWGWVAGAPFNAVSQTPPATPGSFSATAMSTTQIDLAWTDVATETSYEVERSTTGIAGTYSLLVTLPAGSTGYSNTGLTPSTEYCYRVHAVNPGGPSGYAGPTCATTQTPAPPTTPSDLVASATSFSTVHLTWTDNATNETNYEVERSETGFGGTYLNIASLAAGTTTYDDPGRTPSMQYCYRVRAVNGFGNSGYAGPMCATTPGSALDFGAAGNNNTNTYVTFGDPAELDLAQFTIECWFRRDGNGVALSTGGGGVTAIPLVSHGAPQADGSNVDMNFMLGIRSDGVLCADFEEGTGGTGPVGQNHPVSGVTLVGNGWHHGAATYDGTTWRLYLDGNLETTLAVGQPVRSNSIQHAALATMLTSAPAPVNAWFDGALDEVRVWNVARTQAEIQATANTQLTTFTTGLAARWGLDEGTGTAVNGSAGTAVNGTITNTNFVWTGAAPFNLSFAPPDAPTGLAAVATTHSQISLTWNDNSTNESGFEIERSTTGSGGSYSLLVTLPANSTAYADGGLTPSTQYCYRVHAVNGSGPSSDDGPTCAMTPPFGNAALDFSGTTAQPTYASFGSPASLQLSNVTIEMWIRRDGAGEGTNTGTGGVSDAIPLVAKGRAESETAATDINYLFGIRASTGTLCADFEEGAAGSSPSLNHPIEGATPISMGTWHHVAATYDGITWKLYLDGNLDASNPIGQPLASASTVPVALGSALTSANAPSGFFNGAMDEVRIWNVARDQDQIQATANAQLSGATPGLVARWSLDEGSGTVVGASAGTTVNGTITGPNYAWTTPGAPFNLAFNQQPLAPVVVAPADDATGVSTSPSLDVAVSDPEGGSLTVTYYGRTAAASPGADFTLIGLPDTQYYTGQVNGGAPAIFDAQTNWIVANRASRNIVYVGQLGDCVERGDNGGNDIEWQRANTSLSLLENTGTTGLPEGIPFGVSVGNHDQSPIGDANGTTTFYNQFFGESRFLGRQYYGGHYGSNNDNWYELFSASGMDFIVISFEYDTSPDAAVLAWADNLLTTNSNRRAIILSHFISNTGMQGGFGPQGQAIYDALKSHSNLDLMLCGHVPGEGRRQDTYNGNTTHTLLSDYQGRANGGSGWLRILEFSPANNEIRVKTYSPWLGQFENDGDSEFTIPYDMISTPQFQVIGTVTAPSGSTASLSWPGRSAGTTYEWYATVSDGSATTAGPVWSFTTAVPPPLTLSHTQVDVACNGGSTGSIDLSVSGGTPPYSYLWSNSATTQDLSGLSAGTYSVTVTDAASATAGRSVTINEPLVLVASALQGAAIQCFGGTTTVTVSATGGTAPYTGTGSFTVGAGTHNYTVTDANGCSATTSITVTQPDELVASALQGAAIQCFGGTTTVTVSATGGTTPYSGTSSFTVGAGTHNYTVTDANGCTATTSITVTQPEELVASALQGAAIQCFGGTTTVTVSATGGTTPYSGTGSFTVGAGTHNYTVTDANGCSATTSITVTQPDELVASALQGAAIQCFGGTTTVTVSATGGTTPYSGTGSFTVGAGTHNYTVTDANGCSATTSITVTEPTQLTASSAQGDPILCFGGTTTVTVSATGGTTPYSGTGSFTVGAGTHNYTVTDANGCTATTSITVTEPTQLTASSVQGDPIQCFGGTTTVTVSASGGTAPYSGTGSFTVGAGTHNYTVTDANGCSATTSITVTQPDELVASALQGAAILCFGGTTTVTVSATGGTTPYSGTSSFTVGAGTHNYTVTDANGCTATTSVTVTQPDELVASALQGAAIQCFGGTTTVTVSATGGTGPYSGTGSFTVGAGTHNYTVTDANGCAATTSITVTEPAVLSATETHTPTCLVPDGTIDVTVSGGTTPYTYAWSHGPTTEDLSGLAEGTYSLTVTDANGCTAGVSATILLRPAPGTPSGLAATALDASRVELTWTDGATSEAGFEIERSTTGASGSFSTLVTTGADVTSYVDATGVPMSEYCYRVRAANCAGASAYTDVACATTPSAACQALDVTTAGGPSGGYVRVANQTALQLSSFTIELWMRRDATGIETSTGNGGVPDAIPLITKGRSEDDTPANNTNYFLGIRQSDGVLCADFEEGPSGPSPGSAHPVVGTTPIAVGTWHHVAATYDGATWTLYRDGNVESTLLVNRPACNVSAVAVALASALNSADAAAGYFDGAIDEVRIWNVARTQEEIQSTMSQSLWLPTAGLVGRWAFDETSGTTAAGSAGTGINGAIVGTAGTEWDRVACGSWITAVEPEPAVTELAFAIASGNPARGRVQFRFALPQAARVELEIHDLLGRRVASMADREFAPGVHRMTWDGTASGVRVPAGMYFARFRAGRWTRTKSVVVVR